MPHTSRKRGPPSQPRRRRLLDVGDGWTIVSSPSVAKSPTPSSVSTPPSNFETATIHPGVTVEKLNDEYVRYKKTWEDSGCCTEVVEVLKKTLSADLGTTSTNTIPIFAQDPVFNTLDASFLSSHFVTVLPTPAALSHLTPATLLFAPHCERSFLLPILEGSGPELAICNDIEASVIGAMSGVVGESEKEIAGEFLSRRTAWSIPVWKDMEDVVNDLCFYFRLEGEKNGVI